MSLPKLFFFTLLIVGSACAQPSSPNNPNVTLPNVSRAELERLRPAVLHDLKALLARVENDPNLSEKSVEVEFLRCKFTPLKLGTLGRAILVEAEPGHGMTNAAMLNIYLPDHGSYRLILEAAGFGPGPAGSEPIPDLVFGWASGVCHAKYYRYSFRNTTYAPTGCDQESEAAQSSSDDCSIQSCSGENLPTFPNPWPEQSTQTATTLDKLLVGSTRTGAEILGEARINGPCRISPGIEPAIATANHDLVPPGNQVPFSIASNTVGRCGELKLMPGKWETSDSTNTSVDMLGIATCLHPTKRPAKVTYSGTLEGQRYNPATLNCN